MSHASRYQRYGNGVLLLLSHFLTGCSAGIFYVIQQMQMI